MISNQILIVASNLVLRWSSRSLSRFRGAALWDNLTALQAAAVISTLVLTIGAVIEYWGKIKHLALLTLKWIFRKSTPFERCVLRKMAIYSLGPILVVLGIAGEVVFEGRTFIVEDRQEEQSRQTVGQLELKASANEKEAGQLEKDAERLREQAEAEHLARTKLEKEIQPRTISESDRQKIADRLRQFAPSLKGRKVTIDSQIGDGETMLVALEMADILRRSGIEFDPSGMGRTSWVGAVFMGVRIIGPPSDKAFISAFAKEIFIPLDKGVMEDMKPEYKDIRIDVGVKPITGIPKEWVHQTP
jgi:hypothetical protein